MMHRSFLALALCASALFSPIAASAAAHRTDTFLHGVADATSTTFATTSYADLTGATVTVVPTEDPSSAAVEAPGTTRPTNYLRVSFTAVMSKATTLTGTCALYANGAIVAKTAQVVTVASLNNNVAATWWIPNTTAGSQTVKIQCKSADTAVLTVSAGHLIVEEIR